MDKKELWECYERIVAERERIKAERRALRAEGREGPDATRERTPAVA